MFGFYRNVTLGYLCYSYDPEIKNNEENKCEFYKDILKMNEFVNTETSFGKIVNILPGKFDRLEKVKEDI